MKKPVASSHLALRFYKRDGWTLDVLQKYLIKGQFQDTQITHGDSSEGAYFLPSVGSVIDMKMLFEEEISGIRRWYSGEPRESDLDYLNSFNWGNVR